MRSAFLGLIGVVIVPLAAGAQEPTDPFAWLMPADDARALGWSRNQTAATTRSIEASPTFAEVKNAIRVAHLRSSALPSYYRVGPRYLRLVQDEAHPYGLLEFADAGGDGRPGRWRTAFDLDAFNKTVPAPYSIKWLDPSNECQPPVYDRCMLPLWRNGEQLNEYRELDLKAGRFVDGGFKVARSRTALAWLDPDTLVIAHSTEGAPALPSQFPAELHLWKRGTPLSQAPTLFRAPPGSSYITPAVIAAGHTRRVIVSLAMTYTQFQLKEISPGGIATDLPLPRGLKSAGTPRPIPGGFVVQLAEPATINGVLRPADTILAYDVPRRRIGVVATPPKEVFLAGSIAATSRDIFFVGTRNLRQNLYRATPRANGWTVHLASTAQPGTTLELQATGGEAPDALLLEQGLLEPPELSVVRSRGAQVPIARQQPYMNLDAYSVEIRSARSNDGVAIDYYLMHRKDPTHRPIATILQGYGGFGVSNLPQYFGYRLGAGLSAWFARGGALAVAAIRGGGERGGTWHLAGAGIHKRQMFDDFNAVADDLARTGFTDSSHLGIIGHSNGGLLVAGAETMRPDLYGAVLVGAPVTDLPSIGHGDGGIGGGMKAELGDADDPTQRPGILRWSPYQNIRAGVRYPPTLTYVATNDAQVGPGHARKFVAKLQSVGAPALLLESAEGGHDFPNEFTQTDGSAMLTTFLIDALMKR